MNILIKNANVFDGKNESLKMGSNIVIKDDKVREIFSGDICEENFDKVYDAAGYTVIPGLVDSHIHFSFTAPVPVCATYRYIVQLTDCNCLKAGRTKQPTASAVQACNRKISENTQGTAFCLLQGFAKTAAVG